VVVGAVVVGAKRGASPLATFPFRRRGTSHRPYSLLDPLVPVPLLILRPHKPGN
jgi:hypothetical protein